MDIRFLRTEVRYELGQPFSATTLPSPPSPRASALSRFASNVTSFFERILTVIKAGLRSRVSAMKISSALTPFIQSVTKQISVDPTRVHVNALYMALASVSSIQSGAENVLYETVSASMGKLPYWQKEKLLEKLETLASAGNTDIAKLCSVVKKVIIHHVALNAEFIALNAIKEFAGKNFNQFAVRNACTSLDAHLNVLRKINSYVDLEYQLGKPEETKVANSKYTPWTAVTPPTFEATIKTDPPGTTQRQMSYIATSDDSIVLKWFAAESKSAQNRVLANLEKMTDPKKIVNLKNVGTEEAADPSAQRLGAFCKHMQTVLSQFNAGRGERPSRH
jgi:hypothetical protein